MSINRRFSGGLIIILAIVLVVLPVGVSLTRLDLALPWQSGLNQVLLVGRVAVLLLFASYFWSAEEDDG